MNPFPLLPPLQAILNLLAVGLVVLAYSSIRKKNQRAHSTFMIGALSVSGLFLVSYATYHQNVGYVPFAGQGAVRPFFFSILVTHIIAAAAIVPLVLATFTYALRGQFDKHRRIARWTFPLWLYTSITGVLVYLFVFQIYPAS